MNCVSCGIFQYELKRVLPEVESELGCNIKVKYLEMALDAKEELLEKAVSEKLAECRASSDGEKPMLLYGSMCHVEWPRITAPTGAVYPKPANCAEMLIGPEKKREFDSEGNVYFLTSTSFKNWKDIFCRMRGMDEFAARQNFCYFEKIIVLDAGIFEFSDEEMLDFFDYTQVPVELMPITLDYFKSVLIDLCKRSGLGTH